MVYKYISRELYIHQLTLKLLYGYIFFKYISVQQFYAVFIMLSIFYPQTHNFILQ